MRVCVCVNSSLCPCLVVCVGRTNLGSAAFIEPFRSLGKSKCEGSLVWSWIKNGSCVWLRCSFRWDVTKWMSLQSYVLWFQCIYYPLHRLFTLPLTCWAARNGQNKFKFQINFHRKQTTIYMHTRFTIYRSMYRIFASIIELLWTPIQTLCMHFHSGKR